MPVRKRQKSGPSDAVSTPHPMCEKAANSGFRTLAQRKLGDVEVSTSSLDLTIGVNEADPSVG